MDKGWFAIERGRWTNVASKLLKTKASHIGLNFRIRIGIGLDLGIGVGIGLGIGLGLGIGPCLALALLLPCLWLAFASAESRNAEKLTFSENQTSLC